MVQGEDGDDLDPRQRAYQIIADMWSRAGRPGLPTTVADYSTLQEALISYLCFRFKDALGVAEGRQIVEKRLLVFLPPLFLRLSFEDGPSPEDLINDLVNDAVDLVFSRTLPTDAGEACATTGENDEQVVQFALGYGAASYMAALEETKREGSRLEFLVATQHMDLCESLGEHPSWRQVADRLASEALSATDVARSMLRFANRLGGRSRP
jgi:hypothetical protein